MRQRRIAGARVLEPAPVQERAAQPEPRRAVLERAQVAQPVPEQAAARLVRVPAVVPEPRERAAQVAKLR